MALISMRQLLDHAAEHGYGVPAFNVNNLEQMRAIINFCGLDEVITLDDDAARAA